MRKLLNVPVSTLTDLLYLQAIHWIMKTYDRKGGRSNTLNRKEFGKALEAIEEARCNVKKTSLRHLSEDDLEYECLIFLSLYFVSQLPNLYKKKIQHMRSDNEPNFIRAVLNETKRKINPRSELFMEAEQDGSGLVNSAALLKLLRRYTVGRKWTIQGLDCLSEIFASSFLHLGPLFHYTTLPLCVSQGIRQVDPLLRDLIKEYDKR